MTPNLALALTGSITGVVVAVGVGWALAMVALMVGALDSREGLILGVVAVAAVVLSAAGCALALSKKGALASRSTGVTAASLSIATCLTIRVVGALVGWGDAPDAASTLTILTCPVAAVLARFVIEKRLFPRKRVVL